ncbi:hypothetical protein AVEN_110288-1 [Araneus ventricosus]|uniref:Uncharacterized protein n=1 Tax=Araneus ventricosus TaxID=182803 RepID=A0A4Y2DSN6_ARAVE|nr:hypothetical protein AVEN_110288-1 [Araneus ventricosus]
MSNRPRQSSISFDARTPQRPFPAPLQSFQDLKLSAWRSTKVIKVEIHSTYYGLCQCTVPSEKSVNHSQIVWYKEMKVSYRQAPCFAGFLVQKGRCNSRMAFLLCVPCSELFQLSYQCLLQRETDCPLCVGNVGRR